MLSLVQAPVVIMYITVIPQFLGPYNKHNMVVPDLRHKNCRFRHSQRTRRISFCDMWGYCYVDYSS